MLKTLLADKAGIWLSKPSAITTQRDITCSQLMSDTSAKTSGTDINWDRKWLFWVQEGNYSETSIRSQDISLGVKENVEKKCVLFYAYLDSIKVI